MPLAIVAVVVIAALTIGGYLMTSDSDTTTTNPEVSQELPINEGKLPETEEMELEPGDEIAADPEAEPETLPNETEATEATTYTGVASYLTPKNVEHEITVELTVEDGVVTDAEVLYDGKTDSSNPNHQRFDDAYEAEVIGVALSDIELSRTGGASLTTGAFNETLASIKTQAAS